MVFEIFDHELNEVMLKKKKFCYFSVCISMDEKRSKVYYNGSYSDVEQVKHGVDHPLVLKKGFYLNVCW